MTVLKLLPAGGVALRLALRCLVAALWCTLLAACAAQPQRPSPAAENAGFVAVAQRNVARLDRDHDGTLTLDELELALQDPQYRDEDAAAVAALFWGAQPAKGSQVPGSYRIKGPNPDFDKSQLTRADGGVAVATVGARFYRAGLTKLRNANRGLFASSGPHITAIRQTWAADCYFNSAVGAVALVTPERISQMIQKEGGSYRVTFPLQASQLVAEPTDGELAAFTNASDGIWFNLLEKAYSPHKRVRPVTPDADPLDAVDVRGVAAVIGGGNAANVLQLLTGHSTQRVPLPSKSGKSASPQLDDEVRQTMIAAQRDHRAMVAGMHSHSYAVVGFDAALNRVRIHNPWDNAGVERLSGGQQVQRDAEGYFTVTLRQFVDSFGVMAVEQSGNLER